MNITTNTKKKSTNEIHKTLKSLRERDLCFTKADKSNNIIVMEKSHYERIVLKTISQGPYREMENDPLQDMIREVETTLDTHKHELCNDPRLELRKWKVSNPQIPSLYVTLKTHKETDVDGDMKARPVSSNINAPTEAIAKNLSEIFNSLPPPKGKSVKNGMEFAKQVNGMEMGRVEEMGSYDVTALYPSIPVEYTIKLLMMWLISCGVRLERAIAYVTLTALCMKQNIFQFRGKWYMQLDGTCIGCSLSSFVAEIFMCNFEMSLANHPQFPRVYTRYIDDIFAVQNKRVFDVVRKLFEDKMDEYKRGAIKFTIERQKDGKLAFLNTMCEIVDGKIEIDVYRKPTNTMRLITSDSYHDQKHKVAAYHSMAHFMVNLPLTEERAERERNKIVEIGRINGFPKTTIMSIIEKHQKKKQLYEMSTLYSQNVQEETMKRVAIRYYPEVTRLLKPIYKQFKMELVHRNEGTLKQALGTLKDTPPDLHKSGIYMIQCSCCGRCYYGMTIRKLFIRFNEHVKSAKWKTKTAVGRHIFVSNHQVNISDLKLIQPVQQSWKIEYIEAIHIHKHKHENLLNVDDGNIKSPILELFIIERIVDERVIDLTDETPDSSMNETFYECDENIGNDESTIGT